jgi:hypothetical protein
MKDLLLFPEDEEHIIGMFTGFARHGRTLDFHADLVLPYRSTFQTQPMQGYYVLVQLATPYEAMLGRIVSLDADGPLPRNEEAALRRWREAKAFSEEAREEGLTYRVNLHVLGVLRQEAHASLTFVPSHRRLPPLGSRVAFPTGEVLRNIAGHFLVGAALGHLAFGEYVYADDAQMVPAEPWVQVLSPEVVIRFPVEHLIGRRSFIFARAGFGKSNLTKLLVSELYRQTPLVLKRGSQRVPVGTVVFDPDGEYFWPDDKGRPGLCDVPHLQEQLVIFTPREAPSPFYHSFVAGDIRLDLRALLPEDVLSLALSSHKQGQQNVQKLKGLSRKQWVSLVNLIATHGHQTPLAAIRDLLGLEKKQEGEALAARANMTTVVQALHDPQSQMLKLLPQALAAGKICIVDVSQLHQAQALVLSGVLLHSLFQHNQEEFTKACPSSLPILAIIEEAQAVLQEKAPAARPYLCWVKEGRKYDLGALLITQQPGSLPCELLSQGDTWFVLHLLSAVDLKTLQKANAYFSQDMLCLLLNEPLPGHAVMWSSVGGRAYPLSLRVFSFEQAYCRLDPDYTRTEIPTFAALLRTADADEQEQQELSECYGVEDETEADVEMETEDREDGA